MTDSTYDAAMVRRAFEIADQAMFKKFRAARFFIEESDWRLVGIGAIRAAKSINDASPYVKEAVEWLRDRGYVEPREDDWGLYVRVLREP